MAAVQCGQAAVPGDVQPPGAGRDVPVATAPAVPLGDPQSRWHAIRRKIASGTTHAQHGVQQLARAQAASFVFQLLRDVHEPAAGHPAAGFGVLPRRATSGGEHGEIPVGLPGLR